MKTIDTRDLYTRLCELETLRDALTEACEALENIDLEDKETEVQQELDDAISRAEMDFGMDEDGELNELETLRDEIGESTMRDGETMIPESDFEDYARQFAEDMGAIPDDSAWPCTCIDWEQAAKELAQDYSTVSYQGEDYFIRA